MDCSPPGSSVHEILQARILELGCHFLLQGIFLTQGLNPQWKPPAVEAQSRNHWTAGKAPRGPRAGVMQTSGVSFPGQDKDGEGVWEGGLQMKNI